MKFVNRVIVKIFFTTLILLSASFSEQLFASDSEATTVFQKALALANKKSYRTAAKTFLDATQLTNSITMKGKVSKEAMLNFRRANEWSANVTIELTYPWEETTITAYSHCDWDNQLSRFR
jgi:hypothetical protein